MYFRFIIVNSDIPSVTKKIKLVCDFYKSVDLNQREVLGYFKTVKDAFIFIYNYSSIHKVSKIFIDDLTLI